VLDWRLAPEGTPVAPPEGQLPMELLPTPPRLMMPLLVGSMFSDCWPVAELMVIPVGAVSSE
jgi:hypothetical protein